VLRRIQHPYEVAKVQKRLDELQKLEWFLEDTLEYAKYCKRRGNLEEAINYLKEVVEGV